MYLMTSPTVWSVSASSSGTSTPHSSHQFDDVQRICAQILNERGLRRDLFRVDAELLDDDVLDLLFDRFFRHKSLFGLC